MFTCCLQTFVEIFVATLVLWRLLSVLCYNCYPDYWQDFLRFCFLRSLVMFILIRNYFLPITRDVSMFFIRLLPMYQDFCPEIHQEVGNNMFHAFCQFCRRFWQDIYHDFSQDFHRDFSHNFKHYVCQFFCHDFHRTPLTTFSENSSWHCWRRTCHYFH